MLNINWKCSENCNRLTERTYDSAVFSFIFSNVAKRFPLGWWLGFVFDVIPIHLWFVASYDHFQQISGTSLNVVLHLLTHVQATLLEQSLLLHVTNRFLFIGVFSFGNRTLRFCFWLKTHAQASICKLVHYHGEKSVRLMDFTLWYPHLYPPVRSFVSHKLNECLPTSKVVGGRAFQVVGQGWVLCSKGDLSCK